MKNGCYAFSGSNRIFDKIVNDNNLIIGLLEEECYNAKTMPYTETIFRWHCPIN